VSTFDDDERSAAGSRPIDLYTITTPTVTFHLTSHVTDVSFGGATYIATTMSRGSQQVAQDLTGRELVVYLPINHPIVQRFAATGIPEHEVVVTLVRLQSTSGQAQQQWSGFGNGLSIDGRTALLRVPSVTDDAMKVRLPVLTASRFCLNVLYDEQCTVVRGLFLIGTTITSQSGNTVTVATISGNPDGFATFGEAVHLVTGQRRHILAQTGTLLTLNAPFVDVVNGDIVSVFAGCDHTVATCRDKFNNVLNFIGHPDINATINPWAPAGLGVIQQV